MIYTTVLTYTSILLFLQFQGKSLSLICGALTWLRDYEEKQRQEVQAILEAQKNQEHQRYMLIHILCGESKFKIMVIYHQPNKIIAYLTFHKWLLLVCNIHMSLCMLQTKTSHLWKVKSELRHYFIRRLTICLNPSNCKCGFKIWSIWWTQKQWNTKGTGLHFIDSICFNIYPSGIVLLWATALFDRF